MLFKAWIDGRARFFAADSRYGRAGRGCAALVGGTLLDEVVAHPYWRRNLLDVLRWCPRLRQPLYDQ